MRGRIEYDIYKFTNASCDPCLSGDRSGNGCISCKEESHHRRFLSWRKKAGAVCHCHECRGVGYEQLAFDGTAGCCLSDRSCGCVVDSDRSCAWHICKLADCGKTASPLYA